MFLTNAYKHVKRHSSKLLDFSPIIEREKVKHDYAKFLHGIWADFFRISTVHDISQLFHKASKIMERFILIAGFITAICVFTIITWNIYYICRYKPLQTVIANLHLPVHQIPFPEVTICNKNHLNWQRYNEARNTYLKPQHFTAQHEAVFRETVNAYDILRYSRFDVFHNLSNQYPPQLLQDLNYINFTQVVELMAWKCDEMFSHCSWRNQSFDCCDIFSARKSQKGLCLAFNTIESAEGAEKFRTDPYYPWRTLGAGPINGLSVRIHIREEWHSPYSQGPKGILVTLVEPYVWTYVHREILTNTRALISIGGFLHIHNQNTRLYSGKVRKCVFEDELESLYFKSLPGHKYMFENCQSECQQEYLMEYCNCTMDLFFPPGRNRVCRLSDLPCLYRHDEKLQFFEQLGESDYVEIFQKGMHCPCYINCKSLRYLPDYRIETLEESQANLNSSEIQMSVFFLWDSVMVYETTAVYPLIDIVASLGSLACLCIGCSLVAVTELLYFFFFDIPKQGLRCVGTPNQLKVKRESLTTKQIFVKQNHEIIKL